MWRTIVGHDEVVERFRRTLAAGRLASTYLFVGPEGIGKRSFARELAKTLLCPAWDAARFAPCDACESCRLFDAGNHPDFEQIARLPDKSELLIKQFVGEQENRNKEGLCYRISRKPFLGGRRVAIIDDADYFNEESANCLLKTLEEPPPHSLVVLIGTSLARQLPTIRSRAQIVPFRALAENAVCEILLSQRLAADQRSAAKLQAASGGSLTRAQELADPEMWSFRQALLDRLARPGWDLLATEKSILDFVQSVGGEPGLRRRRLRTVLGMILEYYRLRLKEDLTSLPPGEGARLALPASFALVEACLTAIDEVGRNANQTLVVSNWLAALAGLSRPAYSVGA